MTQKPFILAVETSSRIGSVAVALGEKILAEAQLSGPMRHSAEILPAIGGLLDRFSRKPTEIDQMYISGGPGSFTGLRIAVTMAKTMQIANAVKIVAVDTLDVIAANIIGLAAENTVQDSGHERRVASDERIAAILDAKRGQFFIAVYERNSGENGNAIRNTLEPAVTRVQAQYAIRNTSDKRQATSDRIWKKVFPDSLMTASQFLDKFAAADQPIRLLGDGLLYYKDKFKADGIRFLDEKYWSPRAEKVHLLGWQKALAGQFADPLTLQPAYLRAPDVKVKSKQSKNKN